MHIAHNCTIVRGWQYIKIYNVSTAPLSPTPFYRVKPDSFFRENCTEEVQNIDKKGTVHKLNHPLLVRCMYPPPFPCKLWLF